jgi:hypothetical protein
MMMDRPDVQIDGFHRTERPFDLREGLVTVHRLSRVHLFLRYGAVAERIRKAVNMPIFS